MTPEQERAAKEADRDDNKFRDAMVLLMRREEWGLYVSRLNSMLSGMGQKLLSALEASDADPAGINAALRQEHLKGTMNGIVLARDLPETIVQSMPPQPIEEPGDE